MPITIALRFPAGRFHATPWGHHENEGLPEWPPSPWRLLRALVATWKRQLDGHLSDVAVESLLAALAAEAPLFHLPVATLGHTRHYMPVRFPNREQGDPKRVFDAYVILNPSHEVVFHWPNADLHPDGDECRTLDILLSQLGYFGRAESWCSARILPDFDQEKINCLVRDRMGHQPVPDGYETIRVLGVHPADWRKWDYIPRQPRNAQQPWNLLAETADLKARGQRWSDPPGSKWLTYLRRSDCFTPPTGRVQRPAERTRFTVARYVLDVAEGRRPLPLVTDTLRVAEAVRTALLAGYRRRFAGHSPTLAGKDESGRVLKSHTHAFYLPTDEDGDGRIDHCTVYRPADSEGDGFTRDEVSAIDDLRDLTVRGAEFRLLLTGLGTATDFNCPLFNRDGQPAYVWVSATPFIATRYFKRRGRKRDRPELRSSSAAMAFLTAVFLEHWNQRADLNRHVQAPPTVEPIPDWVAAGSIRPRALQFHRCRNRPGDDGANRAFGAFRLRFTEPMSGPLCLGYACHFGMGLFLPEL